MKAVSAFSSTPCIVPMTPSTREESPATLSSLPRSIRVLSTGRTQLRGLSCVARAFDLLRSLPRFPQGKTSPKSYMEDYPFDCLCSSEAVASASVGLRYRCTDDSGAFLFLKQPAHKTFLDCKLSIINYMKTHLDSWCEFANETLGIGLKDKDLIFVSGFTKTTVWAEAAFSDHNRSSEFVIAGGCFVPSVSGEFSVSIADGSIPLLESRYGPPERVSMWKDDVAQEYQYDQSIFLNYYKMKNRSVLHGPRIIRAAAGPHTLPDEDHDDDDDAPDISSSMSASSDSQESDYVGNVSTQQLCSMERRHGATLTFDFDYQQSYDPVDEILDYILKVPWCFVSFIQNDTLIHGFVFLAFNG